MVVKKESGYSLWDADSGREVTSIRTISADKIKIFDSTFIRLKYYDHKRDRQPPILEQFLFQGHYKKDDGSIIEFTGEGKIKGLSNFKYYEAVIDYVGEGMQVDQMMLGDASGKKEIYGYKFKQDSLFIYKLNCIEFNTLNKMCAVVEDGKLIMTLIKMPPYIGVGDEYQSLFLQKGITRGKITNAVAGCTTSKQSVLFAKECFFNLSY